jgi:hypothetical protein
MDNMKEKIQEAITLYGRDIVNEVIMLVEVSDADGVYSTYEDMGMFDHSECVSMIYFE